MEVNGIEVQRGSVKEMSWNPKELIAKLADWAPIAEGDLLFTGTPAGVGPLMANDRLTASLYIENQCIVSHSAICE